MKAIWNDKVLAESEDTVMIENNHYFPKESVKKEYFKPNDDQSACPWKGEAHYYDILVDGDVNKSGAWYYPEPKDAAIDIKDHVAFWNGVKLVE